MYTCARLATSPLSQNPIQFEEFSLDCERYELLRAGRPIKLEKLPMELLILLVEKNGHLVTRKDIIDRLWGDGVFLDTEHGINTAVRKIRHALRDDTERPRFIQTVTGKGYRFVAEKVNEKPSSSAAPSQPQIAERPTTAPGKRRRWWAVAAVVAALFLIAGVVLALNAGGLRDRIFARKQPALIRSIAVLPLANLSGDPAQDYFADGMTDELITMLAKNSALRVISRTSAMQYKGARRSVREIGKELGVDAVVEGSVARSASRVHMTVQLIYAAKDAHLWAESYDRDLSQAFSLPSELSQTIAAQLKLPVSPRGTRAYVNPEAHSEYLQGLYYGSKWGANVVAAVAHFKNSIQRDPTFGPAYAELAISYLGLRDSGGPPLNELLPLAKAAAAKALELDPSLPQAHVALGLLAQGDYNWSEAEVQYRAALTLNPNCAECHHQYGVFLEGMGRNEEAVVQVKQAIDLDPLSSDNRNQLALISFTARQFDLAISQFESLHEAAWWAPLALSYAEKSRFDEALAASKNCEIHWGSDFCLVVQARIYSMWGRTRDARKALDQLKEISRHRYVYPTFFSWAYLSAGDKELALTWMERAYNEKDPGLFWLKVWPSSNLLHSEPRFRALMEKLNFP